MRLLAIGAVACLCALPLQWFVLFDAPIGTIRASQAAYMSFGAVCLLVMPIQGWLNVLSRHFWLWFSFLAGWSIWVVALLYHGGPLSFPVQQFVYVAAAIGVASFFRAATQSTSALRILAWSAPLTVSVLITAFGVSFQRNQVVPSVAILQALTTGDDGAINTQVWAPAFSGFGFSAAESVSQMRHEVFAGLLLAMIIGSWAHHLTPEQYPLARHLHRLSLIAGGTLLLLSLSRSIQLAAVLWAALALFRAALSAGNARYLLLPAGVAATGLALTWSGVGDILVSRATDGQSYGSRLALLRDALTEFRDRVVLGGRFDSDQSTHTMVLDAWLRGGVLMAFFWTVLLVTYAICLANLVSSIATSHSSVVPLAASFILPLVRMFTIGAGLMNPPEWMAMAFGLGVVSAAAWADERRPALTTEPAQ